MHSPTALLQVPRTVWIVAGLTLLAIAPRLYRLEHLSFYADEETTALPARAQARGDGPTMPTGMSYRRALPLTWLEAASARMLGDRRELSYRLPVAILGILAVPALFLAGRGFVGGPAAGAAATLLALSEWHLVFSRQARMYAPFLLCFVLAAWAAWTWVRSGRPRDLATAAGCFLLSITLHDLGLLAVGFVVVPLLFPGVSRVTPVRIGLFAASASGVALAIRSWVAAPFSGQPRPPGLDTAAPLIARVLPLAPPSLLLAALGAGAGLWAAFRTSVADAQPGSRVRLVARGVAAMCTGAAIGAGQLYAAALSCFVFLVIQPGSRRGMATRAWAPLLVLALLAAGRLAYGILDLGAVAAVKAAVAFPFPYPSLLLAQFPVAGAIFAALCTYVALRDPVAVSAGLKACLLAVVVPLGAIGAVSQWGGTRYLFPVYPFFLLAIGAALVGCVSSVTLRLAREQHRRAVTGAVIAALVLSGAIGGHGIGPARRVMNLEHGQRVNAFVHMFPFRPDHRGPGLYVRAQRRPGDILIAEDPLQQYWYAGPVDYWLRSYRDARQFLRIAPDGAMRDTYVGSQLLESDAAAAQVARRGDRTWLVTSGETFLARDYYLDDGQRRWLDSLERVTTPVYTGADGVTQVYCLNCPAVSR